MAGKQGVPQELEGAATVRDVNILEGRVDNCYSKERYEEFQAAVEKIVSRWLKGTVGWAIVVWILSLVGAVFIAKFTNFF